MFIFWRDFDHELFLVIMNYYIRKTIYNNNNNGICTNPQKGAQCMNRMIDLSD